VSEGIAAEQWTKIIDFWRGEATRLRDSNDVLVKALRTARARIEYLGAACNDPRHFQNNMDVVLPMIDAALSPPVEAKSEVGG